MRVIAIAQVDLCVGDIHGNTALVLDYLNQARAAGADTVVFPELTLTAYPPEDLLLRPGLHRQVEQALRQVAQATQDMNLILGHTAKDGAHLYNACSLIRDGKISATYHKRNLPNYGVFDEKRYFTEGNALHPVTVGGVRLALSVCEDLWTEEHVAAAARAGAELLVNVNASPYHAEKAAVREALLRRRALEYKLTIVYVNLVGGQDELVFDGGSLVVDNQGDFALKAPQFEQGLYLVELHRQGKQLRPRARAPQTAPLEFEASVYGALRLGIADYVRKNGFKGAVIGLSGGIDSALTLILAVDALGPENVEALIMPSRYTADISVTDATAMASALGVAYRQVNIEKPFSAFTECLTPAFEGLPVDVTEENIQARCRGILLMAVSNKTGRLVLTTGNKSEMAVGYATLYGDMAGGFAPLKDVPKTLVYRLSRWRNRAREVIPQRIITRPPSAELRFDQQDADSLPPYETLDPILERYIELDQTPEEIIRAGHDPEVVRQVSRMVDKNEYKRRQAAPGVRITERAFGRDRRYPITSRYQET